MGMVEKAFPVKIGLEVHGYLDTNEKLFCMCRTDSLSSEANSNICPICTGTPGSKPMAVNLEAVKKMVQVASVFKSRIVMDGLVWQRKHYDWADNPKGYQTTLSGAHAKVNAIGGKFKGINMTEIHLEEDPAQWNPDTGKIDYNRSGLPLLEMVTEPEFSDSEQVVEWLKSLLLSLSYIKAVRKNAGIKVDVNVSTYGERVEMKNLNSLEKIRKAIDYEIVRQVENYEKGIEQKRDTLAYDEAKGITIKMRSKEGASDYRFVPCPDLPTMSLDSKMVKRIVSEMPEMPEVKLDRLLSKYNVGEKDAKILARNLELVEMFEAIAGMGERKNKPRTSTDEHGLSVEGNDTLSEHENLQIGIDAVGKMLPWITVELLRVLNYNKKSLEDEDVTILPSHLAELIMAVWKGEITKLKGKQIMNDFVPKSFSLKDHKEEIASISEEAVENLCRQVIGENAHVVAEYRGGKAASLNFLIGSVMRLSERRADFVSVTAVMKRLIGGNEIKIEKKIVVSIIREDVVKKLNEFNEEAREILNLSFKDQLKDSGVTFKWSRDDGIMRREFRGPNDEAIKAMCNDLRKFIQPNDSLKIEKLIPFYQSKFVSSKLIKMFAEEMSGINVFLKQSSGHNVNGHDYSNKEVLEIFLYGKFSHRSAGKKDKYDALKECVLYPSLKNVFVTVIVRYLYLINNIVVINDKALREIRK